MEASYDWTIILNKEKSQRDAILFDISKAFDDVPHHSLPMKHYMYGIIGKTYKYIKDFLEIYLKRLLLISQNLNVGWLNP